VSDVRMSANTVIQMAVKAETLQSTELDMPRGCQESFYITSSLLHQPPCLLYVFGTRSLGRAVSFHSTRLWQVQPTALEIALQRPSASSHTDNISWHGLPKKQITTMSTLGEDLLNIVNRLQDLVFNTIGNDSLDLPQIVRLQQDIGPENLVVATPKANKITTNRSSSDHNRLENHPYLRTSLDETSYREEAAL